MVILGINGVDGIFHDASASLLVDGTIIASIEEERFNRKKHSNGLPFEAIAYCLKKAGIQFSEIDQIGYYLDPAVLRQTFLTDIRSRFGGDCSRIEYIERAARNIEGVEAKLRDRFTFGSRTTFCFLNHHVAHAASVYYVSGFDHAAILTVDGSGDRESCVLFRGSQGRLEKVHDFLVYPDSLGFIYNVFAAHLGLTWISGPGKLMGLAGYGSPSRMLFDDIVRLAENPLRPIEIDLSFFDYYLGGAGLSAKGVERFGEPLPIGGELRQQHYDLAASVQLALENAMVHLVRHLHHFVPGETNLCMSGGVALNVKTNRRIQDSGIFAGFFVNPPAYDGGTSLGCALHLDAISSGRKAYAFDVYAGPDVEKDHDIANALKAFGDFIVWRRLSESELLDCAADALAQEKFVGWVQGRMECGPRALGNRSILASPCAPTIKDRLNAGIKKREAFRPYAPSVLREECADWFDLEDSPYMLFEATVHPDKRTRIPAVVHVDGSSRPQTVTDEFNPRYYKLIRRFYGRTGVPMILNTSFNRHGEPVVNRPEEAIAVLLTTELDELFIGDYHIRRNPVTSRSLEWVSVEGRGVWKSSELPRMFDNRRGISHNDAQLSDGDSVRIATAAAQWSYAAGFRLQCLESSSLSAILIRIDVRVEEGEIGILFVTDDLETVLGTPVALGGVGKAAVLDILLEPAPGAGWLIIRNNQGGNRHSICNINSIQAYRAKSGLPI